MPGLIARHRRFFITTILAGLVLRLLFFIYFPAVTDDSKIYADFATNWLTHGVYGHTVDPQIVASDSRLPGYPAFLAAVFAFFGVGNYKAVMLIQIVLDLFTCIVIADIARRTISDRAARIAFLLAALCPFLANYSAAVLTETLEILFTAVALDCAMAGFDAIASRAPSRTTMQLWLACGLSIGACILLRPDGGILLVSLGLYFLVVLWRRAGLHTWGTLSAGAVALAGTVVLLAPWTVRNWRTFHHLQPLAPRYATDADELTPRGFNRWARTWIVDYASVEEVYWSVPGQAIDVSRMPGRAFDSLEEKQETLQLIDNYNESTQLTPEFDARFGALAAQRIRTHPIRYYLGLPLLRIADMWLRPRTEILPPDPRWWEFNDVPSSSVMAVALGLLNIGYVAAACWAGLSRRRVRYLGLMILFVVLRSAFLGSLENPETRYTLECYPVIILLASAAFERKSRLATDC